ncbi:hypothetical protein [Desmospora profundinema]|uniref:Uncharacterized protein n=1 Tax=Desmospora profundinema TaxID=1571184 RepID=A0ABU1IU31_9BACL|nr:hypothetical protein [Desmospora profundinema]MDR6227429.1 hypothetical protein [Desmospora profundinema]
MRGSEPKWLEMEFKGHYGHIIYLDRVTHSELPLRAKIYKHSWYRWDIYMETEWDVEGRHVLGWMFLGTGRWKSQALKKAKTILEDCWIQGHSPWTPAPPRRSFPLTRWRNVVKEGGHT